MCYVLLHICGSFVAQRFGRLTSNSSRARAWWSTVAIGWLVEGIFSAEVGATLLLLLLTCLFFAWVYSYMRRLYSAISKASLLPPSWRPDETFDTRGGSDAAFAFRRSSGIRVCVCMCACQHKLWTHFTGQHIPAHTAPPTSERDGLWCDARLRDDARDLGCARAKR